MAGNKDNRKASNMKKGDPSQPGHGGGHGDTKAKSNNPADWKNEPGNQS